MQHVNAEADDEDNLVLEEIVNVEDNNACKISLKVTKTTAKPTSTKDYGWLM